MFSIGGMAGAAAGGALLAHVMAPELHLLLAAVVSVIVLLVSMPSVMTTSARRGLETLRIFSSQNCQMAS